MLLLFTSAQTRLCVLCFFFILSLATLNPLSAQITVWEVEGVSSYGVSPFIPSSSDPNVSITALSRGSGITTSGTAANNAWGGNGFDAANQSAAITNNEFITFAVKPNTGYKINLSSISAYNIRRSETAPTTGIWQYSLDGTTFTDIGTAITWGTNTDAAGNLQAAIDLSGITALQAVPSATTVTFRLVIWGASNAAGTWYINNIASGNDLELNGAVILDGAATSSASDYFRSRQSGTWNTPNTWESSSDNGTWINATLVPTTAANVVSIRSGHTVLVNSNISTDQLEIKSGGILNYTAGTITLANGAGDDLSVEGVFNHNGGAILALEAGATVRAKTGGEIRVSKEATGISQAYAGNTASAFTYETGAVFHWNVSLAFTTEGQTYFGNAINEIPIFRISQNVGNVGANTPTTFRGILEVNGSVTFQNTGEKVFRDGIRGSGSITQNSSITGKFVINNPNSVLGIANLILNTNGLEINHAGTTTLTRNISLTNGRINLTAGKINLNGFNLNLGSTGGIQENKANNHIITDNTATTEASQGGAITCTARNINNTPTEIAGLGITLNRTTGADYQVNISRYHYQGGGGLGIKKIYAVSSTVSPIPATNLRITYAESELNGLSEPLLISRWSASTGWQSFSPDASDFTANYAEKQGITDFSSWTLSESLAPLPVSLLGFEAKREDSQNISLHWQTANEVNNLGFEVEKSKNGQYFEKIAFVEGKGSASAPNQYLLRHQESESAYYRLKQIDKNGDYQYAERIFLQGMQAQPKLFPNPLRDGQEIHLSGLLPHTLYQIQIRDAQGKLSQDFQSKGTDASEKLNAAILMLRSGIYLMTIRNPYQYFTLKMVKE